MAKKYIFITGASGEIGDNLINYFSSKGEKNVIALDINKPKNSDSIYKFYKGSILDDQLLSEINSLYVFDEIYHLAAILSTKAELNPKIAQEVNVEGSIKIFNLALCQSKQQNKKIKIFFPSSIAVYNLKNNDEKKIAISENMLCNPNTVYGQNKLYCENIGTALDYYGNENNIHIDFRCIRFPGIISVNTTPSGGTSDYAPEMIKSAKQLKSYSCYVSNSCKIPFIVMPDAIDGIIKLMACNKSNLINNVYNITSFSPTVSEFYNEIILYYKNFILTYDINNQRQKIIDSWPGILNDSIANKQWGWKAKYNFKKSFSDYLFSKL